jgi:hypothetical protein
MTTDDLLILVPCEAKTSSAQQAIHLSQDSLNRIVL